MICKDMELIKNPYEFVHGNKQIRLLNGQTNSNIIIRSVEKLMVRTKNKTKSFAKKYNLFKI